MPALIRLYVRHALIGFAIAAAFTGLLLLFDVAGLRHLVTHTADGPLAVALLVVFNGIVFSGVQFGIAVMRLGERPEGDDRGSGRILPADPLPVPVAARARRVR